MDDISATNTRPIAILAGYMATAAALTAWCISIIRSRPAVAGLSASEKSRRRTAVAVFGVLAALSLATTWYHMFRFFQWSYLQWAASHPLDDPSALYLGRWLRDTGLFRQAWASTLETRPRAWWSTQIFGFCANWSVMLATQSKKRNIPHLWAFMLLGQFVAISFASNLSFLAFTVYDVAGQSHPVSGDKSGRTTVAQTPPPKSTTSASSSAPFWWLVILGVNVSIAVFIPELCDHPRFMQFLLLPHILAFGPLLVNSLSPGQVPPHLLNQPPLLLKIGTMALLLVSASHKVLAEGGDLDLVISTLHQHPAVSSVGWDVICCWMSFVAWHVFGQE
ncbi:hypothetical protein EDB81DRAFT_656986 [Dactylonectria macrodidyma]|uniref:Alpha-mannosyltransferase alg11p n=1 Tax=Dactylonectria macrodidyma TaxID=307937 RepID=A0A9P9IWM1_9HYPO|nr:hypothetical protein EDB81DRAFT_656986 [Dactylonectria macrodidyma]